MSVMRYAYASIGHSMDNHPAIVFCISTATLTQCQIQLVDRKAAHHPGTQILHLKRVCSLVYVVLVVPVVLVVVCVFHSLIFVWEVAFGEDKMSLKQRR